MRITALCSALSALVVLVAGCTAMATGGADTPSGTVQLQAPVPALHHVFVMVLENREYDPSGDPQYLAALRKQGATATDYHGISHPSLPNYLALIGGQTFGVSNDDFSGVIQHRTLVDQLEQAGLTWGAYMEDMPTPCFNGALTGEYVMRHDPFMYFAGIRDNPAQCARIQPLPALYHDLEHGPVPNFVWITPNLCHDGHNCDGSAVDAFLRSVVPNITASLAFKDHGALIITYDEGDSNAGCCELAHGGRVETLVLGPGIRGGQKITVPADHYSLLRTIEAGFRLRYLGHAGCTCTSTLGQAWTK